MLPLGIEKIWISGFFQEPQDGLAKEGKSPVVDSRERAQPALHLVMGAGQLGILAERSIRPAVELEIEAASREVATEFLELDAAGFALLPAGSDSGDRTVGNAERGEDVFQERRLILRSEEPDGSLLGFLSLHSALTLTVSPTRSSMRRSSS